MKNIPWWEEEILRKKEEEGKKIYENLIELEKITKVIDEEIEEGIKRRKELKSNREKINILKKTLEQIEKEIIESINYENQLKELKNDAVRKYFMGGMDTANASGQKIHNNESAPRK